MKKLNKIDDIKKAIDSGDLPFRLTLVLTPMKGKGHADRKAIPLGCNGFTVAKRLAQVTRRHARKVA